MRRRKKLVPLFILTILSWIFLGYFTATFPPEGEIRIMNYELRSMHLFFSLIFLSTFSLFSLVLNNTRHGILLAMTIVTFLTLRVLQLTHPFYLIILISTLLALEFTFRKS